MGRKPEPKNKPRFIYNSYGDWMATCIGDNIFDLRGEWVAFLEGDDVWTVGGEWIGRLSKDGRILRKRYAPRKPLREDIPPRPPKPDLPPRAPLPPMFSELGYDTVDVLDEDPDIFGRVSDLKPDMD